MTQTQDVAPRAVAEAERESLAESLFTRLHPVMAWLAALFLLVVVGDNLVRDDSPFATIFTMAGWVIWGVFVLDFVLRAVIAPSKSAFLRRNWWQVVFLALPFLALFRVFLALRVARAGRLLSAAVRSTRSATSKLRNRLTLVSAVTVIVVLIAANLLYEFAGVQPYGSALHAAALATITGEPIRAETPVAMVLNVVLALYSVVVFAAVAGSLGAFFLEQTAEDDALTR
ncbi:MAG TPA: hypothetical protein VG929_06640 [Actinomycetota bacterium]|nr:hypothetical protein [Actinomycetota bacterium]